MRQSKYTKELLAEIAQKSKSLADVLRYLGLQQAGGTHRYVQQRLKAFEIDTTHFTGARWNKGLKAEDHTGIAKYTVTHTLPDEEVFRKGSTYQPSKLAARLLKRGREYRCAVCGLNSWCEKPITLHVDHIDGDISNNEEINLRFICPNCHQQTDTWGRKNKQA